MWQVSEGGGRCQGGCWGPHGGLQGPRCSQRPCKNAAAGGPRPPGARAEASGTGGVGPGATMALRCIVVKASKVFQSCLVTELVLVLRLHHGWPLCPQHFHRLEDVHHAFVPHPLQDDAERDEDAGSAHTGTAVDRDGAILAELLLRLVHLADEVDEALP